MKMVKPLLKRAAQTVALILAWPIAALGLWGRFRGGFVLGSHMVAFAPGLVGSFLRVGFYRLSLERCSPDIYIGVGSFFAHPEAEVESRVGIGAYCVLGSVKIGSGSLLASGVQVLSGGQQHVRDAEGRLTGGGEFTKVSIGRDCWIGASATIMANLGDQVTVAVGSVVAKDVAAGSVVAGNPARVVRAAEPLQTGAASHEPVRQ
jgi:acetyltransferase-like isoleucine patch superfamily enzyme